MNDHKAPTPAGTPRTDSEQYHCESHHTGWHLCRILERELAAANAKIAELKELYNIECGTTTLHLQSLAAKDAEIKELKRKLEMWQHSARNIGDDSL